jgi:hypoxanthine phosphoribosyltransferase
MLDEAVPTTTLNITARRPRPNNPAPSGVARFIDHRQLMIDAMLLASRVLAAIPDLSGVIAIPRSGLYPATAIATAASVPLYTIVDGEIQHAGHGHRLDRVRATQGPLLIVDDSANTGESIRDALKILPHAETAVVYATPHASAEIDHVAVVQPMPHFFAWHFFGSSLASGFAFDLDGVLCHDPTPEEYRDEPGPCYDSFVATARPLYLPRPHKARAIITARLGRYRESTERWLAKHNVQYSKLVMGPWTSPAERSHSNIGEWKASVLRELRIDKFVESDPHQAAEIHRLSSGIVICPSHQSVLIRRSP